MWQQYLIHRNEKLNDGEIKHLVTSFMDHSPNVPSKQAFPLHSTGGKHDQIHYIWKSYWSFLQRKIFWYCFRATFFVVFPFYNLILSLFTTVLCRRRRRFCRQSMFAKNFHQNSSVQFWLQTLFFLFFYRTVNGIIL